ncbi:hypothetical protein EJ04DRAFT_574821 [Polyplosphaeria fusca]|uniref:Uncharacterized protein n=1 Tax=Polyplosphaeria fusca TaxID=682080 RepID=A0A9P4R5H1_9PLEO|nr:hypothetical protein EJ04DRAFT_574821 [Polyplosphaeria fusca]
MRYENWDVILFPRDSHIPLQEFRTACFSSQDQYGRLAPTLTCFIASLPVTTPFRVSLHSWIAKAKPSALIESQRKAHHRVVYLFQIVVDGVQVFNDCFEPSGRWPQEIESEKRIIGQPDRPSSQRKPALEFPPFRHSILMRSTWDAHENQGRINMFLSEKLVGRNDNACDYDTGSGNDIVCFSFQHAPRDVLEQAGISWPIRNPLYLPSLGESRTGFHQPSTTGIQPRQHEHNPRSPLSSSKPSRTSTYRPHIPDPRARPKTAPVPPMSKSHGVGRGRNGQQTWGGPIQPGIDLCDDISMADSWSTRRTTSHHTADFSMPDLFYAAPEITRSRSNLSDTARSYGDNRSAGRQQGSQRKEKDEPQLVMTLRDDQFNALLEAVSPPKKSRELELSFPPPDQDRGPPATGLFPSVAPTSRSSHSTKPSAAAVARRTSYNDLNTPKHAPLEQWHNAQNSPTMYRPTSASGKENRVPTPHPLAHGSTSHAPPPYPKPATADTDVIMRDPSSSFSSYARASHTQPASHVAGNPSPAATGNVKSRKEGLGFASPATLQIETRHDQSLLPGLDHAAASPAPRMGSMLSPAQAGEVGFVPGHRSSMDSLDRIGEQLFSALGDAVHVQGGFEEGEEFGSLGEKRKWNGGNEERERAKMVRGEEEVVVVSDEIGEVHG